MILKKEERKGNPRQISITKINSLINFEIGSYLEIADDHRYIDINLDLDEVKKIIKHLETYVE